MLTEELKGLIADYFEAWELIEFLRPPVEDVVEAFDELIEERLDDILEEMGINNGLGTGIQSEMGE